DGVSPVKQQAVDLLSQAKKAIAEGRYDDARAIALRANDLKAEYGLLELQPKHVLAEIEQLTGTITLPRDAQPATSLATSAEPTAPVSSSGAQLTSAERKERAGDYLRQARLDMNAG